LLELVGDAATERTPIDFQPVAGFHMAPGSFECQIAVPIEQFLG
jgi:hypothetical protein